MRENFSFHKKDNHNPDILSCTMCNKGRTWAPLKDGKIGFCNCPMGVKLRAMKYDKKKENPMYPEEEKAKMKEPNKHEDPYDFGDRFELKTAAENIADFNSKLGEALENQAQESQMREFDTGATRDSDDSKFDYEGFLSPLALRRYAEYMHKHRTQADGKPRDSDNWQKGIPIVTYCKSMWRHLVDLWTLHRGLKVERVTKQDALCAIIFNAFGYLHELEKKRWDNIPDGTGIPITNKQYAALTKRHQ